MRKVNYQRTKRGSAAQFFWFRSQNETADVKLASLIKKIATEYGKDYDLAIELWKENIRECKILATLIMPAEQMLPEIADLWMEQVAGQEMAEMLAFNLLQYVDYAPVIAYQWIASDKPLYEIAGYHILARRFAARREANERGINEFLDQAAIALQGDHMGVKHAAASRPAPY